MTKMTTRPLIGGAAAEGIEDPFDAFNAASGQGAVRDPYPLLKGMRETAPVHRIALESSANSTAVLQGLSDEIFVALSYDAVKEVLTDADRFNSAGYAKTMGLVMGNSILQMDGPQHTRHRKLINRAFTRQALARWETELVRPVVESALDGFAERGRADLVRELTFPFPVEVIAGMIGVPEKERPRFHRLAIQLISVSVDFEGALAASKALGEMFQPLIEERRRTPGSDLMSVLAHAEVEGTRLTDEEIFAFLRLLAPAGAETTYRSSSNLLFGLLSNPEQLAAVRRDRSLIPQAIEEGVRWETPLLTVMRQATRDTEVQGVEISAGSSVAVNLGAANRDEAAFEDPDRFDIQREMQNPHMSFAFGSHFCLGMHLARMETRVVLESLLDRFPDMRLDPEAEDVHITGMVFRSPLSLPVVFEPRSLSTAKPASDLEAEDVRPEMVRVMDELYGQQVITATGGNVSARIPGTDEIWITPSQLFKGELRPESLVRIDLDGRSLDAGAASPSSERLMHCAAFRARKEATAVIHAHAPQATILANSGLPFLPVSSEAAFFDELPRIPFVMPGTQDLADAIAEALRDSWAVLMVNHGLLVAGRSLRRAADMVEIIERSSEIILGCYAVGKEPPVLPAEVVATLRKKGDLVA